MEKYEDYKIIIQELRKQIELLEKIIEKQRSLIFILQKELIIKKQWWKFWK